MRSEPLRLLIISDAWLPQMNGVVRSLQTLKSELERLGNEVEMITPDQFFSIPCPTYPEISLAITTETKLKKKILDGFDAIHIATEGPLGISARHICVKLDIPFTTAYHTKFPEYIQARFRIPARWTSKGMRWFHSASKGVMVSTRTLRNELEGLGFGALKMWSRGVDTKVFRPRPKTRFEGQPVFLYVGRVAVEKNIEDFLNLKIDGIKRVVGDGPQLKELKHKYPEVEFTGFKNGEELAQEYSNADVFVFPSKTDTFGLVLLEALASGIPVAAFPVAGPKDVIGASGVGALDEDLEVAIERARSIPRDECRRYALKYSWEASALQFLSNLSRIAKPVAPSIQACS